LVVALVTFVVALAFWTAITPPPPVLAEDVTLEADSAWIETAWPATKLAASTSELTEYEAVIVADGKEN
jgi:hypothetical protein